MDLNEANAKRTNGAAQTNRAEASANQTEMFSYEPGNLPLTKNLAGSVNMGNIYDQITNPAGTRSNIRPEFYVDLVRSYGQETADHAVESAASSANEQMPSMALTEGDAKTVIDNANDKALNNFITYSLAEIVTKRINDLQNKKTAHLQNNKQPDLTTKEKRFLEIWSNEDANSLALHIIFEHKVRGCLANANLQLTPDILEEFAIQAGDACAAQPECFQFASMLGRIGTSQFGSDWQPNQSSTDVDIFNKFFNVELDGYTIFSLRGLQVPELSEEGQQYLLDRALRKSSSTSPQSIDTQQYKPSSDVHPLINYVQIQELNMEALSTKRNYEKLKICIETWDNKKNFRPNSHIRVNK